MLHQPSLKQVSISPCINLSPTPWFDPGTSLLVQACFKFFALNTITRAENALQSEGTWRNSLSYNPFLKLLHQPHPQWEYLNPATFHFHQSCNVSFRGGCPGIPPPPPTKKNPVWNPAMHELSTKLCMSIGYLWVRRSSDWYSLLVDCIPLYIYLL